MCAFTQKVCDRETHIMGTMGELYLNDNVLKYFNFSTSEMETFNNFPVPFNTRLSGHDYADFYLMKAFINAI